MKKNQGSRLPFVNREPRQKKEVKFGCEVRKGVQVVVDCEQVEYSETLTLVDFKAANDQRQTHVRVCLWSNEVTGFGPSLDHSS